MSQNPRIPTKENVENYILFIKTQAGVGMLLPEIEQHRGEAYNQILEETEYWQFIHSANQHYIVSRILFLNFVYEYSFFSGHQCIENYLKSYLKFRKQSIPKIHGLNKLLDKCILNINEDHDFIKSEYLKIIIQRYEPFYELARYPVQGTKPKSHYGFQYPDDIYVLDYFVFKMRELMPIPSNTYDSIKDHQAFMSTRKEKPDFYNIFYARNINFSSNNT